MYRDTEFHPYAYGTVTEIRGGGSIDDQTRQYIYARYVD